MIRRISFSLLLTVACAASAADTKAPEQPVYPRPLRDLNKSYFPFHSEGLGLPQGWPARAKEIRERILLASGLYPLPTKTPLNPIIHGRVERDDYTIDRVFFESFPGHFVTGSLFRPKKAVASMPGILCPHGHWNNGRFYINEAPEAEIAIGAERWESGARAPLQARCVQLARMGCAVFHYDMLGYADSKQISEHRSGKRPQLCGTEPGSYGLYSPMADLRLESNFGLQTWNSIRALDFILSLDGVDPKRIAVTGASGGGTQTMILSAIDDRVTAAFPCVMVSTGMQGGCTCENACYLRIGQGNIDIAAATAPRPLGMTAADDWTKELQTKGFPELSNLYTQLGKPDAVMATFNTHWKHNYNHVTRTTVYGFMNKHFHLGFKEPVLERDFAVASADELTVWTKEHPAPGAENTGDAHERALLKHWSADSDKLLSGPDAVETLRNAWGIIVGRKVPAPESITSDEPTKLDRGDHLFMTATLRNTSANEEIKTHYLFPKKEWNGTAVLWLSNRGLDSVGGAVGANETAKSLLGAGNALVIPELYLQGASAAPRLVDKAKDPNAWGHAACYTYGYNPTLLASRVHDAMAVLVSIHNHPKWAVKKVIVVGVDGACPVAAATTALMREQVDAAAFDTQSFRFASFTDQYQPMFVPGAVKYGDVPGLIKLCSPVKLAVAGEGGEAKSINAGLILGLLP